MKLKLERLDCTSVSTLGRLYLNGTFECFTLEDPYRKVKIKDETCIPPGTYEVIISYSQRFNVPLPMLLRVPNFEAVRIHWGNHAVDTSGCILLGTEKAPDEVRNSKVACRNLFDKIFPAAEFEKIFIEII